MNWGTPGGKGQKADTNLVLFLTSKPALLAQYNTAFGQTEVTEVCTQAER